MEKLKILGESARFDASCAPFRERHSAGPVPGVWIAGPCRLLKVLMSNRCMYDCAYCVNRASAPVARASFEPRELAQVFGDMLRANLAEGLFLSSAVEVSPDRTMERMVEALRIIRHELMFKGYVHAKVIPGASSGLIRQLCSLATRVSVNLEVPRDDMLKLLAPQKEARAILGPMGEVASMGEELALRGALKGGHTTQIILGARDETDREVLSVSYALYRRFNLRRVYYSAYVPVNEDPRLPSSPPDRLRELRAYQGDFLIRLYGFTPRDMLGDQDFLERDLDPKTGWALRNYHLFPLDANRASLEELMKVPGIGPKGATAMVRARTKQNLRWEDLPRLGIRSWLPRFFLSFHGRGGIPPLDRPEAIRRLIIESRASSGRLFPGETEMA
ncbi:putative DNA modification/repair radical SAM protein [Thermanaerovibrio velox]|nr:putative DNA modification/repair radical SAM protein [Thermanaerovibrio velox]